MRVVKLNSKIAAHLTTNTDGPYPVYNLAILSPETQTDVREDGSVVAVTSVVENIQIDLARLPVEVLVAVAADHLAALVAAIPKDKTVPRALSVAASRLAKATLALNG